MDAPPDQPTFTVGGDRLTLLDTGPRRLDALLDLIGRAKRSIRCIYYIYADDQSGAAVRQALIDARGRGVTVALIVDGFGSEHASAARFFDPLRAAGVELCRFEPRWGRRYLLRNHQKLALADGESDDGRIIIGGFNVEDDYFGKPAERCWRDLGLLVEGPAAGRMLRYFDDLAEWTGRPHAKLGHLRRVLAGWNEGGGPVRWLIGGPSARLSPWVRSVRHDMRRADRIDLIAAYFTPSPSMLRRLNKAGRRGRSVRVVTAAKSDNNATVAAARFTYAGLLKKGVRLFEYQPSKLHTKLYVVDDATYIGSANFDMRSLFINMELMLRIEDRAFADHVRRYIDGEVAASEEITPELYRQRTGWRQRVRQFVAYTLLAVVDPGLSRGLNFGVD